MLTQRLLPNNRSDERLPPRTYAIAISVEYTLLFEPPNLPTHAQGHVHDVVVGRDLVTMCKNTQGAVDLIDSWCLRHKLSVKPYKSIMVLFTK